MAACATATDLTSEDERSILRRMTRWGRLAWLFTTRRQMDGLMTQFSSASASIDASSQSVPSPSTSSASLPSLLPTFAYTNKVKDQV